MADEFRLNTAEDICASPAVSGGRVFVVHRHALEARDLATGKLRWQAALSDARHAATPTVDDQRIYLADAFGTLSARRIRDGRLLWRTTTADVYMRHHVSVMPP